MTADVPEWLRGLTRMSDFVDDANFISFKHFVLRTAFRLPCHQPTATSGHLSELGIAHPVCFSLLHSKQDLR